MLRLPQAGALVSLAGMLALGIPAASAQSAWTSQAAGSGSVCSAGNLSTAAPGSIARPQCGPICLPHRFMSPSGGIGYAAATCADATAAMNSSLASNAQYVCVNVEGFLGVCNYSVVVTQACYQSGSEWYIFGYAEFSCRDSNC
jgi:hypothetical protein